MLAFVKEQEKCFLREEKFGISSTPIVKSTREVAPLVIIWTHHCRATRKARKYSGAHQVLSSRTKMLIDTEWIEVDDHTDLVGHYDNFGDCQQVGEFDYQEVYISPDLIFHIASYDARTYTLDNCVLLSRYQLTAKGADAIYTKIKKREQEEQERALINGREIYMDTKGRRRVNIGSASYVLEMPTGEINQNNVGDSYDSYSSSDPLLHAWLLAAKEVGVPARYAWHGIMSALGDHGSVSIPWKAKPRDHMRA